MKKESINNNKESRPGAKKVNLKTFEARLVAEQQWDLWNNTYIKIPIMKEIHWVMKYAMNMTSRAGVNVCV